MNFAKVLYEMRAAKITSVNRNHLDRDALGREKEECYYTHYLAGLKNHLGMPPAEEDLEKTYLSNKVLNALAEME